ncbi:MAG: inositol 2-dehydrogenase [Proteobacteria bacterium]|nr:inositol 2-dehydrogenase [Pseudomonadota bacterium]
MLRIFQIGAGTIGSIHAANVAANPLAKLYGIADANQKVAEAMASKYGCKVMDIEAGMADKNVDAVLIASSTNTHADLIMKAARAGKAIFCEKPVDLNIERVKECLRVVEECKAPLALGFNRRFDPSFRALCTALREGRIGKLEMVSITSRDPEPPPLDYVKVSGGIFRDMMIHDFDMAQWLLGEKIVEVFATGSCLIEPSFAKLGHIDTALVTLKTESGVLCQINNSMRATYGYDQRVEVLGEKGMLQAENRTATSLVVANDTGVTADKPLYFFLERYADAYRNELQSFIEAVMKKKPMSPGAEDGLGAQLLAEAAIRSCETGQPVRPGVQDATPLRKYS